jgi:hypothetical protein
MIIAVARYVIAHLGLSAVHRRPATRPAARLPNDWVAGEESECGAADVEWCVGGDCGVFGCFDAADADPCETFRSSCYERTSAPGWDWEL